MQELKANLYCFGDGTETALAHLPNIMWELQFTKAGVDEMVTETRWCSARQTKLTNKQQASNFPKLITEQ